MKYLSKILMILAVVSTFALASCETYGTPEVETTAVAPLDGRWICLAYEYTDYNTNGANATPVEYVEVYTSNTTFNDADKLWVHMGCYTALGGKLKPFVISAKADCNVGAKSISLTNGKTAVSPSYMASIVFYEGYPLSRGTVYESNNNITISGEVTINGIKTASSTTTNNYYTDQLIMTVEVTGSTTPARNIKWVIVGGRYTGWNDDFSDAVDFLNN